MKKILLGLTCVALLAFGTPALAQNPQTVKLCLPTSGTACGNVTGTNPLPVTGTFSATLSGFTPNGNYGTLTATAASSASTALPSGAVVAFQNLSTVDVSCVLSAGAATATTNKLIVRGGATVFYTVGSNVNAACINQTGSASNVVAMAGGTGLGTNFGGGGGAGAITIASGGVASGAYAAGSLAAGAGVDGWDLTQGAIADAAVTAGATGSISAKLRSISRDIGTVATNTGAAIPAQSGIGNVNIGAVQSSGSYYQHVAASQTGTTLGATGGTGDYLSHCVIYPSTTGAGSVTVFDNTNSAANNVIEFTTGTLSNLVPIAIPVGAISRNGPWKVTTGANETVVCYGKFT